MISVRCKATLIVLALLQLDHLLLIARSCVRVRLRLKILVLIEKTSTRCVALDKYVQRS